VPEGLSVLTADVADGAQLSGRDGWLVANNLIQDGSSLEAVWPGTRGRGNSDTNLGKYFRILEPKLGL